MDQNSSYLQRLLTLLDTGSTQTTRFAAARQIGDIAKSHPQDLNALLKKLSQYLRSKNWDTRVAAAQAIGFIAQNVKHTSLKELCSLVEAEIQDSGNHDTAKKIGSEWFKPDLNNSGSLTFRSFDINKVLEFGSPLLASGGQEYDVTVDNSKNPAERLARQKQNLRRRLGLDVCEQFMDVSDVIKDEDLLVHNFEGATGHNNGFHSSQSPRNIPQLVSTMLPGYRRKKLSARELNLLKRKAKTSAKDHTKSVSEDENELQNSARLDGKNLKAPGFNEFTGQQFVNPPTSGEDNLDSDASGKWPFFHFVEQLIHDMFDPVWEIRHGAIMGLREILTYQGGCAGVSSPDMALDGMLFCEPGKESTVDTSTDVQPLSHGIDLNEQLYVDEYEPSSKRCKLDHGSTSFGSAVTHVNGDLLTGEFANQACPLSNTINVTPSSTPNNHDMELDISTDESNNFSENDGLFWKRFSEQVSTIAMEGSIAKSPESCKIMKLIKLARHSCISNWEFLQDCAIRFICILSLDRFGDYVSDQVVAPVRETCAQALGAVLKYMHPPLVFETLRILLHMQYSQEWEIRHGSLLGIKYLVAVRQEMLQDLLVTVVPACRAGLEDPDDDVRAVAADALIPAAASMMSLDDNVLHSMVMLLWDILLDLDDLSPSTSSVMNLLAEIYCQPEMATKMLGTPVEKQQLNLNETSLNIPQFDGNSSAENPYVLSTLTPRLWPFMRHSIMSVRHSAIQTLERLLAVRCERNHPGTVSSMFWPTSVLGDALQIVFQNFLLESSDVILQCSERVWNLLLQCPENDLEAAASSYFSGWLELAITPYGSALDPAKLFWPVALPCRSRFRAAAKMRTMMLNQNNSFADPANENSADKCSFVPNNISRLVVGADSERSVMNTRVLTSAALGSFASKLPATCWHSVINPLWNSIKSSSAVQRQVACMVFSTWFKELRKGNPRIFPDLLGVINNVKQWLLDLLGCTNPALPTKDSLLPYDELARTYTKMRTETKRLSHLIENSGVLKSHVPNLNVDEDNFSVDEAIHFASELSHESEPDSSSNVETNVFNDLESSKQRLLSTCGYLKLVQNNLHGAVTNLVAAAVVWTVELPNRLNPIILPLMAAIRREQEEVLQEKAAEALAELIFSCVDRKPSPNDKLIKNLCMLACADFLETPQSATINSVEVIEDQNLLYSEKPSKSSNVDKSKLEGFISRRGSEFTMKYLCWKFGGSLFSKIPKLWDCLTEFIKPATNDDQVLEGQDDKDPQLLINNIQIVRSIAPLLDKTLEDQLLTLLPSILVSLRHSHVAVRLAASRCITTMALSMTNHVMSAMIEVVIPMLSDTTSVCARQGAGMLVRLLVQVLGVELVPYAPLLIVPLLKCMNDSNHSVRKSVTQSFATLVPLLPLAKGMPLPDGLSERFSGNADDLKFLDQLLNNKQIDDYKLSVDLNVDLRRYQQEGINWLAFLRRFKLHGILCDDMGLGKTLQASAILASDIAEWRTQNNDSDPTMSLIICPTTLVGHWVYEIEKHIASSVLNTLQYVGSAQERTSLRSLFDTCNVIVTSYDIVRKDIDYLSRLAWNYCILDEGHIIKNSRSKITCAVKQLKAEHRLILSGTPIQNNVLELWSLFDYLMPGFLGSEKQFQLTYGKPLSAAKDTKCSAKDKEAGILAMEALHKQVMPFILRRTKDEVLSDLPEKIIQDRYCDLSPLQLKLYEQFSYSNAKDNISTLVKSEEVVEDSSSTPKASRHVFQALQYLLKLCSHPLLAIGNEHLDLVGDILSEVSPGFSDLHGELRDLRHSPKLVALKEILQECGIGLDVSSPDNSMAMGQHRVLIFAQHKALLDIIEKDIFGNHMKGVTFLRLDGSVEPEKRFEIVKAFNSDPTIDVLLLTTHVGGLGLNLTSADTLIFMEHDWNPMRDLQAMDRAHRLGQKRVVNVHRLIMRGTLEEKVMNLQKFKMSVANAVINSENASMKTMNTDQLLDLFTSPPAPRKGTALQNSSSVDAEKDFSKPKAGGKGLKAILGGLEELWDQSQYTNEYDLGQFLSKLNS